MNLKDKLKAYLVKQALLGGIAMTGGAAGSVLGALGAQDDRKVKGAIGGAMGGVAGGVLGAGVGATTALGGA